MKTTTSEEQKAYSTFVESFNSVLNDFLCKEDINENDDIEFDKNKFIQSLRNAIDTYCLG
jgi:hypothetical protein